MTERRIDGSPADWQADALERELGALFEQTAETPSGAQITRMAARAADIPRRSGWRRRRWLWLPAAVASVAVAALVLMTPGAPRSAPEKVAPARQALAPEPLRGPIEAPEASAPEDQALAEAALEPPDDLEPVDGLEPFEVAESGWDGDDLGMDVLSAPLTGDDDELWLDVMDRLLKDG